MPCNTLSHLNLLLEKVTSLVQCWYACIFSFLYKKFSLLSFLDFRGAGCARWSPSGLLLSPVGCYLPCLVILCPRLQVLWWLVQYVLVECLLGDGLVHDTSESLWVLVESPIEHVVIGGSVFHEVFHWGLWLIREYDLGLGLDIVLVDFVVLLVLLVILVSVFLLILIL